MKEHLSEAEEEDFPSGCDLRGLSDAPLSGPVHMGHRTPCLRTEHRPQCQPLPSQPLPHPQITPYEIPPKTSKMKRSCYGKTFKTVFCSSHGAPLSGQDGPSFCSNNPGKHGKILSLRLVWDVPGEDTSLTEQN